MLAPRADAKALKEDEEDEQVIYAEGGFNRVAGYKFKRRLATLHDGNPTREDCCGHSQHGCP